MPEGYDDKSLNFVLGKITASLEGINDSLKNLCADISKVNSDFNDYRIANDTSFNDYKKSNDTEINKIKNDNAYWRGKSTVWGAVAGTIGGILVAMVSKILTNLIP